MPWKIKILIYLNYQRYLPEKFAKAIVRKGLKPVSNKTQITLRLDTDVLNWFKAQGQGYQTKH